MSRGLKKYNVTKDGITILYNVTVEDITKQLDIHPQSIRASDKEGKPIKGYYFKGVRDRSETKAVIPKPLLDEWDIVTSRFRCDRKIKLIISKMQIVKKA